MSGRVVFHVPALHCDGCIASVRSVLEAFSGVHSVEGDLDAFTLTVDYDLAAITPQAMRTQLDAIGYPADAALSERLLPSPSTGEG